MQLRNVTSSDCEVIAEIHRNARKAAMPWLPMIHTRDEDLNFFKNHVLPTETVLAAVAEEKVIGFAAFEKDCLNHLYIDPAHWRRGAGSLLLRDVMNSVDDLQLWTFQRNQIARNFYAAHGFAEVEFTNGESNEENEPDVRMEWKRSPTP